MADNELLKNRARAAVLSRDFSLAVRLYKSLLKEKPLDTGLLLELGNLYIKSGNDDLSLSVLKQIITIHPDHFDALNNLGGVYRRLKKYPESIAVLEQALATGHNKPQVLYNLGFTYKLMEKFDDAIECFEEVIIQNPLDALAFNHLGVIYAQRGDHDAAVASYVRGLKIDQNHPVLLYNMAKSLESLGNFDNAISAYESALRSKPGWLEAVDAYSHLLVRLNKTKDAANVLEQALHLHPKEAKLHTRLGKAYARQYAYHQAESAYEHALLCNGSYAPARSGLATVQEELGKNDEAVKTMQLIEAEKGEDPVVLKQYIHILLSANLFKEASVRLLKLWNLTPDDLDVVNLMAQYYICTRNEVKVTRCFEKIEMLNPEYAAHLRDGAFRYRQIGDLERAEKLFRLYLDTHGPDSSVFCALGAVCELRENKTAALAFYKKALAADKNNVCAEQEIIRLEHAVPENIPSENSSSQVDAPDDFASPPGEEIILAADDAEFTSDSKLSEPASQTPLDDTNDPFDFDQFGADHPVSGDTQDLLFVDDKELDKDHMPIEEQPLEMLTDSDLPFDADAPSSPVAESIFTDASSPVSASAVVPYPVHTQNSDAASPVSMLQKQIEPAEISAAKDFIQTFDSSATPSGSVSQDSAPEEPDTDVFDKASEMLPSIVSILMDPDSVAQFKPSLEMFKKLRALSEHLPSPRKEAFLSSRTRMLLDYVISKLSGAPGLLAAADALRKSGLLADRNFVLPAADTGKSSVANVLSSMRTYVSALTDPFLRQALDAAVAEVLEKL